MKIKKFLGISVFPDDTPGRLFSKVDIVCDEARRALSIERRDPFRDPYKPPVYLVSAGRYKSFEQGVETTKCRGSRRPLTARELLSLNLYDPTIRHRFPIFAGDFVLEYEVLDCDAENTVVINRKWKMGLSSYHRGFIIDRDSVFAMTDRTDVDRGKLRPGSFREISTIDADHILRLGGSSGQTLRLTA